MTAPTPVDPLPEAWRALPALALRDARAPLPASIPVAVRVGDGTPSTIAMRIADPVPAALVSCLMVTRGALWPAAHAIECFRRQTWGPRELVVVDDSADSPLAPVIAALDDPRIRHVRLPPSPQTLGDLRNLAVALAAGDLVCQWDDDDLHDPLRIEIGVRALHAAGADAVFLDRWITWWPQQRRLCVSRRYVWEGSMLARRAALPFYASLRKGEDTQLVLALRRSCRIATIDVPWLYCYDVTGHNTWDALHFEGMFSESTVRFGSGEYAALVDEMDRRLPMRAFERGLAAADAAAGAPSAAMPGESAALRDAADARAVASGTGPAASAGDARPSAGDAEPLPKVSVIVRSMGRPELVDALSSLALQTYANVEVIVVDATGGRHAPLPALRAPLDVRLVSAGRPLKRAEAANAGFAAATGDWLGMLDDDDFVEPTHLARLVARTRAADRPDLVHAASWLLDRYHRVIDERSDAYNALTAYFVSPFLTMAVLFARSHWDRGPRFDETFDVLEDWDFFLQVLQHARVGRVVAHTQFFFQEAGTSGTGTGRNRGGSQLAIQQRLQDRWHLRRNSVWLEHYKRFGPGLALQAEGRVAEARAHFARVLAASPAEPNALFQLGQTIGQEGTLYAARRLIEHAMRLNRNAGEYSMALARIEEALGNDVEAIRQFETAARLVPAQEAMIAKEIARLRTRLRPAAAPHATVGSAAISRNALCPCGSGLRYKACHGREGADTVRTGAEGPSVVAPPQAMAMPAPTFGPPASAGAITAALAAMTAAYREGDLVAAAAHCDRILALDPVQQEALHARALLAADRDDVAAAQRHVDAMPGALRAQPEIAALRTKLHRAERRQRETGHAEAAIRELPFLRDRAGGDADGDAPAAHAHLVLSAERNRHLATLATASRLRAALGDAVPVTVWLADTDASMPALPAGCRALAPEDGAHPRDGAIVFVDTPALPPTWLATAHAERLVVHHRPERTAETLELLVTCHRHAGLPVRLVHGSERGRARQSLPGLALPRYVDAEGALPRDDAARRPFTVGLAGHNDPREFDAGVVPLLRALAAGGAELLVRGGTLLMRHFPPSHAHPGIALRPDDAESADAFLRAIDCLLHWPGARRPSVLPVLVHDAMAAGLPVVCARDADAAEAIDDGRDGYAFDGADAAAAIVARLAADRALARRVGDAAATRAQAWTGEAARARIQALLLR